MKTLIFWGSPRLKGDSRALLDRLLSQLEGEYLLADAYRWQVKPCVDCRMCREKPGCVIRDDMQKVYDYMQDCDNVLIVSPLYFSEVTGPLLNMFSRLQHFYSARRFRREQTPITPKHGGIILTGGGDGGPDKALDTAKGILRWYMNVQEVFPPVLSLRTDERAACEDPQALMQTDALAAFLNERAR